VLLRHVNWSTKGIKWWATTTQLTGALMAFGGLSYAYLRATYGLDIWGLLERWWAWWLRLWGKSTGFILTPTGALVGVGTLFADVVVGFRLDRTLRVEDQLAQVEKYINEELLLLRFPAIDKEIRQLRRDLEEARKLAEAAARQALADAEAKIEQLAARLDRSQVLDLRWAAGGLLITAVGTFLSYWPR